MQTVSFKLIFRSWWRNKTFSIISIFSLAIGIACTNLLAAFVIHEYNIEAENPNKDRILYVTQDSPMKKGEQSAYVTEETAQQIKNTYPEVEDFLIINKQCINSLTIENKLYAPIDITATNASFTRLFPTDIKYGDLNEALTQPNKIALSEKTAEKLFGKINPIGKTIYLDISESFGQSTSQSIGYKVAAVFKEKTQSFFTFEALTMKPQNGNGGATLLLTTRPFDKYAKEAFALQLKKDKIPTLQMDKGRYYFLSIQDAYFMNNRQPVLLYIGIISALLILLIACFNYINLNFSRILQQVKTIHIQKQMGATVTEINRQLFTDTFLTVLTAFSISLLITHDLLPVFNRIVSGKLHDTFFFNYQVFPVIIGFVVILSVVPAFYMSRKVSKLSSRNYTQFFTGNRKKRIVFSLVTIQYIISISLITATLTVDKQMAFIQKEGERYQNLIEIGDEEQNTSYIRPFAEKIKVLPGVEQVSVAGGSLLNGWLKQIVIKEDKGDETYYSEQQYSGTRNILQTLQIKLLQGFPPEEAIEKYSNPVYINEKYAELLVPQGENPIGHSLMKYDSGNREDSTTITTIAGITENLYTNSFEKEVDIYTIAINDSEESAFSYLYIRLKKEQKTKTLVAIQKIWEEINPGNYFTYTDTFHTFIKRNKRTTEMADILLMYSIISIFLTCFGLFGMALYAIRQKTKEIGIRKVNGATTWQIMWLLNQDFIKGVGIAFFIAVPCTWLAVNRWLEYFTYRVQITFSTCLLAGCIVLSVTLLTISIHSWRAANGNPVNALKNE